jgi:hypothetical protein
MNKEDIIRMAREAGFDPHDMSDDFTCNLEDIERFAALVAAAEREACVQIIEEYRISGGNSVAGELAREWTYNALKEIRDDIRARI